MRWLFLLITTIFLFENCEQKADPLTEKTYTAEKIGWTIQLPDKKWKEISEQELNKMHQEGSEIIQEATEMKIDNSDIENLINLKKNQPNYFLASIQPYDSASFKNYDEMVKELHDIIKVFIESKKISAEYEIGATRIDGLMLDRYIIRFHSKKADKKIFYQEYYTCLINNYVLSIILGYNNDRDRETLQNILQSSDFTMSSKF